MWGKQSTKKMRNKIRSFLLWFLTAVVGVIVVGVVGEWFIKFAEEQGAYESPSETAREVGGVVWGIVSQSWFVVLLAILAGLTAGAWLDWWAKLIDGRRNSSETLERLLSEENRLKEMIENFRQAHRQAGIYRDELSEILDPDEAASATPEKIARLLTEYEAELRKMNNAAEAALQRGLNIGMVRGFHYGRHPIAGLENYSADQARGIRLFWDRSSDVDRTAAPAFQELKEALSDIEAKLRRKGQVR